jgi:hypothetical protein
LSCGRTARGGGGVRRRHGHWPRAGGSSGAARSGRTAAKLGRLKVGGHIGRPNRAAVGVVVGDSPVPFLHVRALAPLHVTGNGLQDQLVGAPLVGREKQVCPHGATLLRLHVHHLLEARLLAHRPRGHRPALLIANAHGRNVLVLRQLNGGKVEDRRFDGRHLLAVWVDLAVVGGLNDRRVPGAAVDRGGTMDLVVKRRRLGVAKGDRALIGLRSRLGS